MAELEEILRSEGTVTTVGYSVQPEYRYPREGPEPQIAGYAATDIVRVTTSRLEKTGELIDASVKAERTASSVWNSAYARRGPSTHASPGGRKHGPGRSCGTGSSPRLEYRAGALCG